MPVFLRTTHNSRTTRTCCMSGALTAEFKNIESQQLKSKIWQKVGNQQRLRTVQLRFSLVQLPIQKWKQLIRSLSVEAFLNLIIDRACSMSLTWIRMITIHKPEKRYSIQFQNSLHSWWLSWRRDWSLRANYLTIRSWSSSTSWARQMRREASRLFQVLTTKWAQTRYFLRQQASMLLLIKWKNSCLLRAKRTFSTMVAIKEKKVPLSCSISIWTWKEVHQDQQLASTLLQSLLSKTLLKAAISSKDKAAILTVSSLWMGLPRKIRHDL